ncbi:MAG: type II toxin-antitoxin system RelE/ParE family toxin [Burkholderiales bacterium]|nr:type II toxin-antitoxin system RelE/ParE family toxin [Opitutaceae bacterium]
MTEARDWYDRRAAGLGHAFLDEVSLAMRALIAHPEGNRFYYKTFRRVLVSRFPYKIFYQIIGARVVVFRVLHAKQSHTAGLSMN